MTELTKVWVSGKQCRTFADLDGVFFMDMGACCRMCGELGCNKPLAHYSVRHYICRDCAAKRADEVLPRVKSAERRAAFWERHNG